MAFYPELYQVLYAQQQAGIDTDCSFEFVFIVPSENGEPTKKFIHGHKLILSAASEYFKTNFKAEWGRNLPIPITNCEYSVFKKLLKAVYLSIIEIDDLGEACKLYEAAHFYYIEGILRLLREKISQYLMSAKTIVISSLVNLSFKYDDSKLKHFSSKVFAHNAHKIIKDPDFFNYSTEIINQLYQLDDIAADEIDLMKGLEKYMEETKVDRARLQPAIDAIRFLSLTQNQVYTSTLLTDIEKFLLKTNVSFGASKKHHPRKAKTSFFHFLSPETQAQLQDKFSHVYCWICKKDHSVHGCSEAKKRYQFYCRTIDHAENYVTAVKLSANFEDYSKKDIIGILMLFQTVANLNDVNFLYFKNINEEIDNIYYI